MGLGTKRRRGSSLALSPTAALRRRWLRDRSRSRLRTEGAISNEETGRDRCDSGVSTELGNWQASHDLACAAFSAGFWRSRRGLVATSAAACERRRWSRRATSDWYSSLAAQA